MNDDLFEEAHIDLTPLIDVVFMLLIFFIMTTTFSKPVLDIVLPKSETAEAAAGKPKEVVIGIRADGGLYYNGKAVSPEAFAELLDTMPDTLLDVHVDEKAPFEAFVRVVDVAREKRGGRFVISTQTPCAQ